MGTEQQGNCGTLQRVRKGRGKIDFQEQLFQIILKKSFLQAFEKLAEKYFIKKGVFL